MPSPRFVFHRLLRREELCPGGPLQCPGSDGSGAPCSDCPSEKLDRWFQGSAGLLLRNVIDIDFALQVRMNVGLDDLSYAEFVLLRVLNEEKNRLQEENLRKARDGRA